LKTFKFLVKKVLVKLCIGDMES